MTSALTPAGSTRAWRQLRLEVLARDGYECQMTRDGQLCGRPATTADHVLPRARGGDDSLDNLRAACAACNYRAGGRLVAAYRPPPPMTPAIAKVIAHMDAAGLPADAGRRHALTRLGAIRANSRTIDAACRWRRQQAGLEPAATAPPSRPW